MIIAENMLGKILVHSTLVIQRGEVTTHSAMDILKDCFRWGLS